MTTRDKRQETGCERNGETEEEEEGERRNILNLRRNGRRNEGFSCSWL